MLRDQLDHNLPSSVVIPPQGKTVVVSTLLPARGIANGLLRGRSNGRFYLAVVAAEDSRSNQALLSVLASGRLAPGRNYLNRLAEIKNGTVFSRVAGVALGDQYTANIRHDLNSGSLHVLLTSTRRHTFGTQEVQVNPLASRMVDSALNNVGTYGVRFDVNLNLTGHGHHQLVMSHPVVSGKKTFTAFRGSIRIQTRQQVRDVHVGLRSGESLALNDFHLQSGMDQPVRVSLVYPADATPGHLLSVAPVIQLAQMHQRQLNLQRTQDSIATTKNRQLKLPAQPPAVAKTAAVNIMRPAPQPAILPFMDAYSF